MHAPLRYGLLSLVALGSMACCHWYSTAKGREDKTAENAPAEDPPRILVAAAIDGNDQLDLVSYHSIFIGFSGEAYNERLTAKISLDDVRITNAGGEKIDLQSARKKIAEHDTPIIVTSYHARLPAFYANMFAADTLHFSFPKKAPEWRDIESPGSPLK